MERLLAVLVIAFAVAACTSTAPADTTGAAATSETAPPGSAATTEPPPSTGDTVVVPPDGAPTEASLDADRAFREVPEGFEDCGTAVLSSGWPTTTAYFADRADCILDAAAAGAAAQYSYTGRNQAGGMRGTILRVLGPGDIRMVEYVVSPIGSVTVAETACSELTTADLLPVCA